MAKYTVTFSCGHTETIELFGSYKERERKIAWFEENGVCSDCYYKKQEEEKFQGCEKVEMHYSEYKNKYSDCETVRDSYDSSKKTIIVYVPFDYKPQTIKERIEEAIIVAMDTLEPIQEIKKDALNILENIKNSKDYTVKTQFDGIEKEIDVRAIKNEKNEARAFIRNFAIYVENAARNGYDFRKEAQK